MFEIIKRILVITCKTIIAVVNFIFPILKRFLIFLIPKIMIVLEIFWKYFKIVWFFFWRLVEKLIIKVLVKIIYVIRTWFYKKFKKIFDFFKFVKKNLKNDYVIIKTSLIEKWKNLIKYLKNKGILTKTEEDKKQEQIEKEKIRQEYREYEKQHLEYLRKGIDEGIKAFKLDQPRPRRRRDWKKFEKKNWEREFGYDRFVQDMMWRGAGLLKEETWWTRNRWKIKLAVWSYIIYRILYAIGIIDVIASYF